MPGDECRSAPDLSTRLSDRSIAPQRDWVFRKLWMTGHFHCGILFLSLFLSRRDHLLFLPKANAKCQNSTLPKLSNSPRDLARGAIHHRGWFHGLTRGSNRLEFKKGNSGAHYWRWVSKLVYGSKVYVKQMKRKRLFAKRDAATGSTVV